MTAASFETATVTDQETTLGAAEDWLRDNDPEAHKALYDAVHEASVNSRNASMARVATNEVGVGVNINNQRPQLSLVPEPEWDALAAISGNDEPWQERALCAQTDPEAFFPEKGGSTREAKRICLACEVRDQCLDYALAHDERFGIWGGLSERERRRLKRGIT